MNNIDRLCKIADEEIGKIAEKGLNTGNLDTACKLIAMCKEIKNIEYWDIKSDYYMALLNEMNGGYSQGNYSMTDGYSERGRIRDSMGRYSRESSGYSRNSYDSGESYNGESFARGGRGYSNRGYSREGNGYSRNGYSGAYDDYMDAKHSYRAGKTPECKQRLMDNLEQYMDDFTQQMEEMLRDSDCQEERSTIKRYIEKIKNIA